MHNYQLIIKLPFKALDDMEARKFAEELIKGQKIFMKESAKLQETFEDKAPRGVQL
jgi:hypothetical protein